MSTIILWSIEIKFKFDDYHWSTATPIMITLKLIWKGGNDVSIKIFLNRIANKWWWWWWKKQLSKSGWLTLNFFRCCCCCCPIFIIEKWDWIDYCLTVSVCVYAKTNYTYFSLFFRPYYTQLIYIFIHHHSIMYNTSFLYSFTHTHKR